MFASLLSRLGKYLGITGNGPRYGLMGPAEFARLLEIERERADRGNTVFSLLTFTAENEALRDATYARLVQILRGRLRNTDQAGWLDEHRIGAVLPIANAAGACSVADDVCAQFSDSVPAPLCTVLTYPADNVDIDEPVADDESAASKQWSAQEDWSREEAQPAGSTSPSVHAMESLFYAKTPIWKRFVDVVGSGLGLLFAAPLLAVIAVAIKVTSPGPVLFSQMRSGLGGRKFRMYKFRSMVVDAEARKRDLAALNEQDGPAFKVKNDPRVTPLGRFLRTTSLDELPQLWNVFRGDMSLVGPRPLPCAETAGCDQWHRRRLDVAPGLTCIWQIRGRSKVTFDEWARMDIQYVRSRTLWGDLKLILQTVPAVLTRNGAH